MKTFIIGAALMGLYLLIGGIIHGIAFGEEDDYDGKKDYTGVFFWPAIIFIWIGTLIGNKIKKYFNIKS